MNISDKDYYSPSDFIRTQKYDAHMHYHTFNDLFVRKTKNANIHLFTINTNLDSLSIDSQFEIAQFLHQRHTKTFNFLCTFDATLFSKKSFAEDAIEQIKKSMTAGAKGVKIWKNIGMSLKNEDGQYIMADDPVFDPIFTFLEKEKIPLLTHLGEPQNCWLPVEQMTINSAKNYFSNNPEYHMYLHPEAPSYEQHLMARDRILECYPGLIVVGAHLGSMEWNLEEVAKRLDRFPNFFVDISGRFEYIFDQTIRNRNYVIDFFQTYQDRLLYGTDCFVTTFNSREWMNLFCTWFPQIYMNLLFRNKFRTIKKHWLFLATDKLIKTGRISNKSNMPDLTRGLKLSKNIVDLVFYKNAHFVYNITY